MNGSFNLFLVAGLVFLAGITTQAQVNDAGLWTSLSLEKRLNKKFSVELNQEVRLFENLSEVGSFYTEIGASYRLSKIFEASAGYRFINKRRLDDSYSIRHRFLVNLNARKKWGQVSSALRVRYQSQYRDVNSSEDGRIPENYLRTKLTFKYDLNKRYQPVLSGETFFHLNHEEGVLMDGYRIGAALEYDLSKRSDVELGYLIDREVQRNNPWTNYVITLSWNYRL
jgi:hypothetical protein